MEYHPRSSSIFSNVSGPTTPSTSRLNFFWKALTVASVFSPKVPVPFSGPTGSVKFPFFANSFSRSCNCATALPLLPIRRIIR